MTTTQNFDLIIIGGGAAGIMAAISCKTYHPDFSVAILDRTFALGRKILVCGAGRCNITNINLDKSVEKRYYGASKEFIKSIFDQFSYQDIVSFFNDLGVELYIERKTEIGKVFPVTDQAKTITALLEDELKRLGVKIFLSTSCEKVEKKGDIFEVLTKKVEQNQLTSGTETFHSKHLILSAGGQTYPALGSNGSGYKLAESLGHEIVQPVPSALPLVGKNPISQELQGTKMEIEVTSIIDGQEIKKTTDDVMFTQYGLSGPAILNISREVSIHIHRENKQNAYVKLNFFPGKSFDEVRELLGERWYKRPNQTLELSLFGIFPNKIPSVLLKIIELNKDKLVKDLKEHEIQLLCEKLTDYKIKITDTRGWNEAEFTAGGVDTNEVKEKSLESKKVDNLYFCGEILDVDGDVGGFNLSWAWSSGRVAGKLENFEREQMAEKKSV